MKVFVTGGAGFLGLAIVEQLLKEGHEVVTYSRGKYETLEKLPVIHRQGDLSDYVTLKTALRGCKAVFHVAAKTGVWGSYSSFYETNVTGTENILKACLEQGISYLVYTSSASVVFNGTCEGKDEKLPYPDKFSAFYPKTKAIAERAVLNANTSGFATCSLRPHLIWGPGDPHLLPRFLARQRKGQLRTLGKKKYFIDTIYLDNAAHAHLQAFNSMRNNPVSVAGKAYFISQDEPITIRDFIDGLLHAGGLPRVDKTVNPRFALFAARVIESAFRLFNLKSEPPLTFFVARQLSSSHWYDISAAKRDFGYFPLVSITEGMKRLKEWIEAKQLSPLTWSS